MVELSGELVAYPCPNKQGLWAYRKFADGTLLEVELAKEEWFALHECHRTKDLDKIGKLNQHPLNQALSKLLERAKEYPLSSEIYLISLARSAFAEDVPSWDVTFPQFRGHRVKPLPSSLRTRLGSHSQGSNDDAAGYRTPQCTRRSPVSRLHGSCSADGTRARA